jgi:hypothetical protein
MTSNVVPNVNVRFDDPTHLLSKYDETVIAKDISAAVKLDTAALQVHHGATINLMVHSDPSIAEVASSPSAWVPTATDGIVQSAAEVVINTGHQPTTAHPWQDGDIYLNPAYLSEMFLNPSPAHQPAPAVPANKVDAVSLFAHEFIHIAGMEGFFDQQATTPQPALPTESNFDALIGFGPTGPVFDGAAAEASNGGAPVELTAGDLYHVGDATNFADDLMNGDHMYTGWRYEPSALDDAILVDLGYHLNATDHLLAGYV